MSMVSDLKKRVLAGELLGRKSALALCDAPLEELSSAADEIRRYFCADTFDICTIVNGKCGRCSEDCKFCAQSAHYHTDIREYPLLDTQELLRQAQYNAECGVLRYSIVTSGRRLSDAEVDQVCASIRAIRENVDIKV